MVLVLCISTRHVYSPELRMYHVNFGGLINNNKIGYRGSVKILFKVFKFAGIKKSPSAG